MIKRKTFKELSIKDNFMFGAVMCEENIAIHLGINVKKI